MINGKRLSRKMASVVHFSFRRHAPGNEFRPYSPPRPTQTVMLEHVRGWPKDIPIDREIVKSMGEKSHYDKSTKQYLENALHEGKKIIIGESVTRHQDRRLKFLAQRAKKWKKETEARPTIENIQKYYHSEAAWLAYRNKLVVLTIRRETKKGNGPIESIYGTGHSLLSTRLHREKIPNTGQSDPMIFSYGEEILRKLELGRKPNTISAMNYKRAYAQREIKSSLSWVIFGKEPRFQTDEEDLFQRIVERALLQNLTEKQVEDIYTSKNSFRLLEFNGIPLQKERTEQRQMLEEMVRKKHPEYRHLLNKVRVGGRV